MTVAVRNTLRDWTRAIEDLGDIIESLREAPQLVIETNITEIGCAAMALQVIFNDGVKRMNHQ